MKRSQVQVLVAPPLPSRGALAQLVERLLCKQDVNGSNPLGSTNHTPYPDQKARHDQQMMRFAFFARPVGRTEPSGSIHIVQRDNQRCRSYPRKDAMVARPPAALSKSSTTNQQVCFAAKQPPALRWRAARQENMRECTNVFDWK